MSETKEAGRFRKSSLDISSEAMQELSSFANQMVSDYFAQISEVPVFPQTSVGKTLEFIGADLPIEAVPLEQLFADCKAIIEGSRHNGHPRFFGYVASPATPAGAFADLITSTLNANVTSWRSGPAATEIESLVVRWLGSLIGYGEDARGLLMSGGSIANLTALFIAHRTLEKDDTGRKGLWNSGSPMTIYASDQIHMSIPKAADILGIGREQVRTVSSDANLRLDPGALREAIQIDLENGLRPFCVVASAGTVNTGAIDSFTEIASIARAFGLWFHIDGAYGALGALDEGKRPLFAGLDLADSVSLDPHKWLYVPIDSGCLLFRNHIAARAAFGSSTADYIKVHEERAGEDFAFWDYGPELSRRFRALKIWFTLRYYGVRRIADAIAEDNALAAYLARKIEEAEDFELLAPVTLSICCFRYLPKRLSLNLRTAATEESAEIEARLDQLNTGIMHRVQRGGKAYLSNATVDGKFALRACITNFRTTRVDIDQTLEIVRSAAREMTGDHG